MTADRDMAHSWMATKLTLCSVLAFFILASTGMSPASSSAAIRRRVFPSMSRGRTESSIASVCPVCGDVLLRLSRKQFRQQGSEPVHGSHPTPAQGLTSVHQHPQRLERTEGQHPQALGTHRDLRDRVPVVGVGLAGVPGAEQPHPGRQLAGTSTTSSPASSSRCAKGRPTPFAPSTAQVLSGHALAYASIAAWPGLSVVNRPWPSLRLRSSTTSIVADILWGSTPMMMRPVLVLNLCSIRCGQRNGQCHDEQGSPFLSHASPAVTGGPQTDGEPHR